MAAVVLKGGVDKSEVVQRNAFARFEAGGISLADKIGGRQLNPDGELVLIGDEVHVLEAQVLDIRGASVNDSSQPHLLSRILVGRLDAAIPASDVHSGSGSANLPPSKHP